MKRTKTLGVSALVVAVTRPAATLVLAILSPQAVTEVLPPPTVRKVDIVPLSDRMLNNIRPEFRPTSRPVALKLTFEVVLATQIAPPAKQFTKCPFLATNHPPKFSFARR